MGNSVHRTEAFGALPRFEPRFLVGIGSIADLRLVNRCVGAARRSVTVVRRRMGPHGRSVLPLSVVALACAMGGLALYASEPMAAAISGIAGFVLSAIRGSMLFQFLPSPVLAVELMILCGIANQAAMTWSPRRDMDWRALGLFLLGGALGLPIGVWLLIHADRAVYTAVFGVFLLTYGLWTLLRQKMMARWRHPALDVAVGFAGGISGGAAGLPGVAVTIWCGVRGWDKTKRRAPFQPFVLLMRVATLVMINLMRPSEGHGIGFEAADLLRFSASLFGAAPV